MTVCLVLECAMWFGPQPITVGSKLKSTQDLTDSRDETFNEVHVKQVFSAHSALWKTWACFKLISGILTLLFYDWAWCHPATVLCTERVWDSEREAAQVGCVFCISISVLNIPRLTALFVNPTELIYPSIYWHDYLFRVKFVSFSISHYFSCSGSGTHRTISSFFAPG